MDFPTDLRPTPQVISSYSRFFPVAQAIADIGGTPSVGVSLAMGAGVVALMPFTLPFDYHIQSFFTANGTVATGTVDIGIYTPQQTGSSLTRIVSAGAIAMSGTSTLQIRTLGTPFLLEQGTYFLAAVWSTTGTCSGSTLASSQQSGWAGLLETAGSNTLTTSITGARSTTFKYPLCGFSRLASGY